VQLKGVNSEHCHKPSVQHCSSFVATPLAALCQENVKLSLKIEAVSTKQQGAQDTWLALGPCSVLSNFSW
jgi:hypothetical protein